MLLNFTVKNWMSYRNEAALSMIASRERQHGETLAKIPGFRSKKTLPLAAIYGGNASGKTGFLMGLECLKQMVCGSFGVKESLPVMPFILNEDTLAEPTVFDITFLVQEKVYRFVVEAKRDGVHYESLELISERKTEEIYERDEENNAFSYNEQFFDESKHVEYAFMATRKNQLFLGNAVSQNVTELDDVYNWFDDSLTLISVESHAWSFVNSAVGLEGFLSFAESALSRLDTGIVALETQSINAELLPKDADFQKTLADLKEDEIISLVGKQTNGDYGFEMITVRLVEGKPSAELLCSVHEDEEGNRYPIPLGLESSGTQRLMGLIPMLFDLVGPNGEKGEKVFIVDELDRCFHSMLTAFLIEQFSSSCNMNTRKQLLFTTHDLLLMDQKIMRRDEMYIAQRKANGCSELIGLDEYEGIRFDKDLVKSYLEGRFGGIPMFSDLHVNAESMSGLVMNAAEEKEAVHGQR